MVTADVQKLLKLDLETRLQLVEQLWNSIVDDANAGASVLLSAEIEDARDG